jgi:HAD superfamily hydrolase (TIGR01549 family)
VAPWPSNWIRPGRPRGVGYLAAVRSIDAVVFDMDGTLLDSADTVPAAYAAAIYELSGVRCTHAEVIAAYSAGPASALLAAFIGREAGDSDVACWHRHLERRLSDTMVYRGIPEVLGRLGDAGLALGVFTGATRHAAQLQLNHSELAPCFRAIVGSDEVPSVKPAPDGLLLACERLGVPITRTLYVGDAKDDLLCARAAEASAGAAAWGHLYEEGLEADLILETPEDLLTLLRE